MLFSGGIVREWERFTERNVVFRGNCSGMGVFSRTECCFQGELFGNRGVFPNGMLFSGGSVREWGSFSERNVVFEGKRSGIG